MLSRDGPRSDEPSSAAMIAIANHRRRLERRDREETARLLVRARGYHGAVDACLRNGWEEILTLLLAARTRPGPADTGVRGPASQILSFALSRHRLANPHLGFKVGRAERVKEAG